MYVGDGKLDSMIWRVIDTGCEDCSCNLRGRHERIEDGTLVQSSVGYDLPSITRVGALGASTWHQYGPSTLNRSCPRFTCRLMPAPMRTASNQNVCFVPIFDTRQFKRGKLYSSAGDCRLHAVRCSQTKREVAELK